MPGLMKFSMDGMEFEVLDNVFRGTDRTRGRTSRLLTYSILGLGLTLSACGTTQTQVSSTSKSGFTNQTWSISEKASAAFKYVNWTNINLPGKSLSLPGMAANVTCKMSPMLAYASKNVVVYWFNAAGQSLAIVPGKCATVNQSPVSFFLYQGVSKPIPKLLEVIYEGNLSASLLTHAVPTASVAALQPHPWVGLFEWNASGTVSSSRSALPGIRVKNERVLISGLVIPKGGTPPIPASSIKGMVTTTYTYRWSNGLLRFVGSTAGVSPVVLE